jgi:hypothetical protein
MRRIIYIILPLALALSSCGDFLEEYSQDTDYPRSWEDLNETLIGDCYMPMYQANNISTVSDRQYFIHFLGDELVETPDGYSPYMMMYDDKEKVFGYFTWQARNGQNDTYTGFNDDEADNWTQMYRLINVANNIIFTATQVPQSTAEEQLGVKKVDGEAHFLRAYYYFWLVNLYGKPYQPSTASTDLGVPIKTSEKVEDKYFERNSVQECYDQILSDLAIAEDELGQVGSQPSVFRADVTAVRFLLSRVYLYMQNWEQAAAYAQKVLDDKSQLVNLNSLSVGSAFLSPSSVETIFSMGGNSMPCFTSFEYKGFSISNDVYNLYADDDLRKTHFLWHHNNFNGYTKLEQMATDVTTQWDDDYYYQERYYLPWAYVQSEVSDKFLFRTAEAYLIKAEAEAYLGDEDEARSLLNTLRANRYAQGTDYQVTATGNELVQTIRDERERELCLEGQRWFDLRRYGVCQVLPQWKTITHDYYYYVDRNSTTKVEYHTFTLQPNDWGYVLAIPQEAIEFNQMTQNERGERTYTVTKCE